MNNTIIKIKTEIITAIDDKIDESSIETKIIRDKLYVPVGDIYDIINTLKIDQT